MSEGGTPVTTYYEGFPKAPPSLPPSTRRWGRGGGPRRTVVGIPTITAELKPACRHSSPRSDLERRGEGGRGGWGLGKTLLIRPDKPNRHPKAGRGPRKSLGVSQAPPPPPPPPGPPPFPPPFASPP